jgi:hypothetical protein
MSPFESVRSAGKLWISEEDIRTDTWRPDSGYGQAKDAAETVELLKRQFSNILVHQTGAWWCDWAGDHDGSFNHPEVMELFARLIKLGQHNLSLPNRGSGAEVAIVIDAESAFYRSTDNNFDIPNWRNRAWGISRMGAPVDYVLLSDLLKGKARDYKMYFMMNTFHLTAAQRETLKALLRRDGKLSPGMELGLTFYATTADDLHVVGRVRQGGRVLHELTGSKPHLSAVAAQLALIYHKPLTT